MPASQSRRFSFRRQRLGRPSLPLNHSITLSSDSSTASPDDDKPIEDSQINAQASRITLGTLRPFSVEPKLEPGYDSFLEATPKTTRETTPTPSKPTSDPDFEARDVSSIPPTSEQPSQDSGDSVEAVDRLVQRPVRPMRAGRGEAWSGTQELRFLQLLAEAARAGLMNPQMANWLSNTLKKAAAQLQAQWPGILWAKRVKNKYNHMKKRYREWQGFGRRSGVSIDPQTGRYRASEHCFKAYFAANPGARWIRRSALKHLDLYQTVFDTDCATGDSATTATTAARRLLARARAGSEVDPAEGEAAGERVLPGRPKAVTAAQAQFAIAESIREIARLLAEPPLAPRPVSRPSSPSATPSASYLLQSAEPWIRAAQTLTRPPWAERLGRWDRLKLIETFRDSPGVADWWLSDEPSRAAILDLVRGDPMDVLRS